MNSVIGKIFARIAELEDVDYRNEIEIIYAKSICFEILSLIEELQYDNEKDKK